MSDWRKLIPSGYKSYLESLPEEIYNLSDTSHLVRLLDALCGDSGVGFERKLELVKRMQTNVSETRFVALDAVYSYLFGLPRLESERYGYATSDLLTWSEQQEIQVKDAAYRKRIIAYMKSWQYGGTCEGVALAAQAAVGCECKVIEGHKYFNSKKVENNSNSIPQIPSSIVEGINVIEPPIKFGQTEKADHNEYVIIVMRDEPLSSEELRSVYTVTSRISPVDAKMTCKTLLEVESDLLLVDNKCVWYDDVSIFEESSHWWNIAKFVTGRPDWNYSKYPSLWVEPNVRKEAPRQLLVNSQEDVEDFSFMVKSVAASTEHVGFYNRYQSSLFSYLQGVEELMKASNALSRSANKKYTASFYGGNSVINWSYPVEYTGELSSSFLETARSFRFWSSEEREGNESLDFTLKKNLPINKISFNVCRKPMKIKLFASSSVDENGNRVWVEVLDENGTPLTYSQLAWSGESVAGSFIGVDFSFPTVVANAFRLEFERKKVPYLNRLSQNAYEQLDFDYSVELSDASFKYETFSESSFVHAVYEDAFGNKVENSLRVFPAKNILDGNPYTYWVSQPNIGQDAVEYIILKMSDGGVRFNSVFIESIYDGCQVNIYSTQDEIPGNWKPYPDAYTLASGKISLPTRVATYIKLEFTNLCAMPYEVCSKGILISQREFPYSVKRYANNLIGDGKELSKLERMLLVPQYETSSTNLRNDLGITDIYAEVENDFDQLSDENWSRSGFDSSSYRTTQGYSTSISSAYGQDMLIESSLNNSRATSISTQNIRAAYKFFENGTHEYDIKTYERLANVAFVVGIKEIKVGFEVHTLSVEPNGSFMVQLADSRFIDDNNHWDFVDDERMAPANDDIICSFETVDLQTVVPFRTFEFAVNEKPPRSMFEHPSDMAQEWGGYNSDVFSDEFGVSGTVLATEIDVSKDSGIQSDAKLVRSKSIANAQVDVFPLEDSKWVWQCEDLYGENVFSMRYDLKKGRWTTVGAVFNPMPGSGWWSMDYRYRIKIPLSGPIAEGTCVFVPFVDFDALLSNDMRSSKTDGIRLIYFNGVDNLELDCDITDNMEIWFKICQNLLMGEQADGQYHFDTGKFLGAYYLYFGNELGLNSGKRDYTKVFKQNSMSESLVLVSDSGTHYVRGGYSEIDDAYRLGDKGFMTFEIEADSIPEHHAEDFDNAKLSHADVRFILDYVDEEKRVQVYTFDRQLTFVIVDRDSGYESAFVSKYEDAFVFGTENKKCLIEWDEKGTDGNRHAIKVWLEDATLDAGYRQIECINNVYSTQKYIEGAY